MKKELIAAVGIAAAAGAIGYMQMQKPHPVEMRAESVAPPKDETDIVKDYPDLSAEPVKPDPVVHDKMED